MRQTKTKMTTLLTISVLLNSLYFFLKTLKRSDSIDIQRLRTENNIGGVIGLLSIMSGLTLFINQGSHSINIIQYYSLGISLRIDSVSLIMFTMVSLIAYFVFRFSVNYLSGDHKHQKFNRLFHLTVGTVQLLVISGNLLSFFILWALTSIFLQQLLQLYPERKKATRAARTKFVIARMADLTLISAFAIIYLITGTGEIQDILFNESSIEKLQNTLIGELVVVLISLTAILKSVQFPFHTWIFGVLELPTPLSALLHAGLLNAGPFLVIRFSLLYSGVESASAILLISGAISAIFGSTAFITQPSIKTGLVFSSIGHMGFSLMLCGLGLYAAAFLHLVSHSFYKAYQFLSSGSIVSENKSTNHQLYERSGNFIKILISLILAVTIFLGLNTILNQYVEIPIALSVVGIIMVIGIFSMLVYSFDTTNTMKTSLITLILAVSIMALFYMLELSSNSIMQFDVLNHEALGFTRMLIIPFVITLFLLAAFLQILALIPSNKHIARSVRIHFRNGLYIDSIYRRLQQNRK